MGMGMDLGFNDRVDKVFGSISSSTSTWSLTDAQVERREWNRSNRDDDQIPVFSCFHDDDWDIRSSIGLDSTLDNEEEEDAYDKMAQGRENENGCHRLYMKDVTDHGLYYNVLPHETSLKVEDDEPMLNAQEDAIKSILKRKTCDEVPKPAKRVRFDSTCKDKDADPTQASGNRRAFPDYILNPSKYTRYTLDDTQAYLEETLPKHGQKSSGELLPKSLVFIPRKKGGGNTVKQSSIQACPTIAIAAVEGEMQEDDDADVSTKARGQKPLRQYRSKMEEYDVS